MGNQPSSGGQVGGPPRPQGRSPQGAYGGGGPGGAGHHGGDAAMGYATASTGYGPQPGSPSPQYGGAGAAAGSSPYGGHPQAAALQQHQQQQQYGMKTDGGGEAMSVDGPAGSAPQQQQQGQSASASGSGGPPLDLATLSQLHDDDTVPTVFRWEHGGRQVYITGTFNGWSRQIPMHRSGNDFTYIHNLKRGKHAFKFIVDDEWRFAPDQPTVADVEGRINNFIDVSDFKAYTGDKDFERERQAAECGVPSRGGPPGAQGDNDAAAAAAHGAVDGGPVAPGGEYNDLAGGPDAMDKSTSDGAGTPKAADPDGETFTVTVPDLDEYTKEPPPLPPHLRHIILNKPPQLQDTAALPVPQHVALNHLYCTAIKDNMMVLGITQRYKTKFCTTVYYSPCS